MIGWKSCREVSELVSHGFDRELGFGERFALGLHFRICRGCERFNRQMQLLRQALERLPEEGPDHRAEARAGAQST